LRCIINFSSSNSHLIFPISYNSLIQGFIYRSLDKTLSDWLHNEAIRFEKRHFRFFTFSRLIGRYKIEDKKILFFPPVRLYIGTIHKTILESLIENMLKSGEIILGKNFCYIESIEIENQPEYREKILVKTLSPITIRSTLKGEDGKEKSYYYSPFEKDWERMILDNLRRKAKALGWKDELKDAHIKPVKVSKKNFHIVFYRNTVIKAWSGIYEISLPEPYFRLAYDAGVGAKNSQGFGMVKWIRKD